MYENTSMKLNPYLGRSKNLMEFFVIVGYEEKLLLEYAEDDNINDKNLDISIISSVESDLSYCVFDPDKVIKQIYPDKPKIIKIKNSENRPNSSSVLFYSCFDTYDGKSKILYSCYALRFYEELKVSNNSSYYIPKAFLIFSQYPYFTTFHNICSNIYEQKKDNFENKNLPIEILLYCLVNYIPSPIINNLRLKLFPKKNDIIIKKLTCYPYIDFNLCEIFNTIPIEQFIKIYMLTFLEISLLFFSPDLVKMNILMYIFYILNYPLIDSNYYWHIKSISKKEIKNGLEALNPTFRGVNAAFESSFDFSKFRNLYYIVDVNKKILRCINDEVNKESTNLKKLLDYVDKILSNKKIHSHFLSNFIISLKNKLTKIKKDYNNKLKNISKFFYVNKDIMEINKQIQEAFYDFILNILIILYKDYKLDDDCKIIKKIETFHEFSEEEIIFLNLFRYTIKYNTYFDLFIKRFSAVEELKIALVFSDEYVNARINDKRNQIPENINYFNLMDKFYCLNPKEYLCDINKLNEEISDIYNQHMKQYKQERKNQLFELNNHLIKIFLFHKKSRKLFNSLKLKEKEEMKIDSIEKQSIIYTIENHSHSILSSKYYITCSIVFIFSIVFPLFPHKKILPFLNQILFNFSKIKFFQRYYLFILLKSIHKYYLVNLETGYFPELNLTNIKSYCILIKEYMLKNSMIPNEEIFIFLKNVLSEKNDPFLEDIKTKNKEDKKYFVFKYMNEENYESKINEEIFKIYRNSIVFSYKEQNKECNLSEENNYEFENSNQRETSSKNQGNRNSVRLFNAPSLHQFIFSYYDNYFTELNFKIENIDINYIIGKIINIIYHLALSREFDNGNISCLATYLLNSILVLETLGKELEIYKENNIK